MPCPSYFADRDQDGLPDLVEGVIALRSGEADRLGIEVGLESALCDSSISRIVGFLSPRRIEKSFRLQKQADCH